MLVESQQFCADIVVGENDYVIMTASSQASRSFILPTFFSSRKKKKDVHCQNTSGTQTNAGFLTIFLSYHHQLIACGCDRHIPPLGRIKTSISASSSRPDLNVHLASLVTTSALVIFQSTFTTIVFRRSAPFSLQPLLPISLPGLFVNDPTPHLRPLPFTFHFSSCLLSI